MKERCRKYGYLFNLLPGASVMGGLGCGILISKVWTRINGFRGYMRALPDLAETLRASETPKRPHKHKRASKPWILGLRTGQTPGSLSICGLWGPYLEGATWPNEVPAWCRSSLDLHRRAGWRRLVQRAWNLGRYVTKDLC